MRLNYTLFGVLLLLWSGCDFSEPEPEPEIEPPTVVEKDPVCLLYTSDAADE